jgi:TetR/AcrR family transcriptional repressor of nem operon
MIERVAQQIERLGLANADTLASSVVAEMVGALSLARAESDAKRSDAILAAFKGAEETP